MSNPEFPAVPEESANEKNLEQRLWDEEESVGIYQIPLPEVENSLEIGMEIADQDPRTPDEQRGQIGQFVTCTSPESHQNQFNQTIDFLIPDGTPVLKL